jgi:hypothetical protein
MKRMFDSKYLPENPFNMVYRIMMNDVIYQNIIINYINEEIKGNLINFNSKVMLLKSIPISIPNRKRKQNLIIYLPSLIIYQRSRCHNNMKNKKVIVLLYIKIVLTKRIQIHDK